MQTEKEYDMFPSHQMLVVILKHVAGRLSEDKYIILDTGNEDFNKARQRVPLQTGLKPYGYWVLLLSFKEGREAFQRAKELPGGA